ncbi:MAG TPA: NUDIX domain-containing protein [Myxococcaceae bacterium]|nr:NUDIX domain-containing protein [Myxococcaceae bacterium]
MSTELTLPAGSHFFTHRVAVIVLHGGRVLECRDAASSWSYLPGGRVRAGESTPEAARRELKEELGVEAGGACRLVRPVFLVENFFQLNGRDYHEVGVYYLAELPGEVAATLPMTGAEPGGPSFAWVPLSDLARSALRPVFLRARLADLPPGLEHVIVRDSSEVPGRDFPEVQGKRAETFAVVYRFVLERGREARFREAWRQVTRLIRQERGGLGSRLQKTPSGEYLGYARWPSREAWTHPPAASEALAAAMRDMNSCVRSVEVLHELEILDDLWA